MSLLPQLSSQHQAHQLSLRLPDRLFQLPRFQFVRILHHQFLQDLQFSSKHRRQQLHLRKPQRTNFHLFQHKQETKLALHSQPLLRQFQMHGENLQDSHRFQLQSPKASFLNIRRARENLKSLRNPLKSEMVQWPMLNFCRYLNLFSPKTFTIRLNLWRWITKDELNHPQRAMKHRNRENFPSWESNQ